MGFKEKIDIQDVSRLLKQSKKNLPEIPLMWTLNIEQTLHEEIEPSSPRLELSTWSCRRCLIQNAIFIKVESRELF